MSMTFTPTTIAGLVIAASFAAGLNVYATVLTLGLLARLHWVSLPPGLDALERYAQAIATFVPPLAPLP